jgi:hypothetical protein
MTKESIMATKLQGAAIIVLGGFGVPALAVGVILAIPPSPPAPKPKEAAAVPVAAAPQPTQAEILASMWPTPTGDGGNRFIYQLDSRVFGTCRYMNSVIYRDPPFPNYAECGHSYKMMRIGPPLDMSETPSVTQEWYGQVWSPPYARQYYSPAELRDVKVDTGSGPLFMCWVFGELTVKCAWRPSDGWKPGPFGLGFGIVPQ